MGDTNTTTDTDTTKGTLVADTITRDTLRNILARNKWQHREHQRLGGLRPRRGRFHPKHRSVHCGSADLVRTEMANCRSPSDVFVFVVGAALHEGSHPPVRDRSMEGTPETIDPVEIERGLQALPCVAATHDLHIWSLTIGDVSCSVHVVTSEDDTDRVLRAAQEYLFLQGIEHTTIQVEKTGEGVSDYPHHGKTC